MWRASNLGISLNLWDLRVSELRFVQASNMLLLLLFIWVWVKSVDIKLPLQEFNIFLTTFHMFKLVLVKSVALKLLMVFSLYPGWWFCRSRYFSTHQIRLCY